MLCVFYIEDIFVVFIQISTSTQYKDIYIECKIVYETSYTCATIYSSV